MIIFNRDIVQYILNFEFGMLLGLKKKSNIRIFGGKKSGKTALAMDLIKKINFINPIDEIIVCNFLPDYKFPLNNVGNVRYLPICTTQNHDIMEEINKCEKKISQIIRNDNITHYVILYEDAFDWKYHKNIKCYGSRISCWYNVNLIITQLDDFNSYWDEPFDLYFFLESSKKRLRHYRPFYRTFFKQYSDDIFDMIFEKCTKNRSIVVCIPQLYRFHKQNLYFLENPNYNYLHRSERYILSYKINTNSIQINKLY